MGKQKVSWRGMLLTLSKGFKPLQRVLKGQYPNPLSIPPSVCIRFLSPGASRLTINFQS